jgi:hypothetical protein
MNSMKTLPLFLLTLTAYNPCGHAAPAAVNPPATTGEVEVSHVSTPASPTTGYNDPPTVTPFFTPAVFLDNYYTRPRPVRHGSSPHENDVANMGPEPIAAPELVPVPATATTPSPTESLASMSAPEPTAFEVIDTPGVAISPLDTSRTTLPLGFTMTNDGDATLVLTVSSTAYSFSVPTSHITLVPQSSSSHYSPTASVSSLTQPTQHNKEMSPETLMSRKAALIGTILAVASLLGISVCTICTRCCILRAPRKVSPGDSKGQGNQDRDAEKALNEKTEASSSGEQTMANYQLPSLAIHAPPPSLETSPSPEFNRQNSDSKQQPDMQSTKAAENTSAEFEDVTHILSEDAFTPLSDSTRTSAASDKSETSVVNRASNGAVSVKAESYATCESCYSTPSTSISQRASEGAALAEYLSMESPSRSPSPPESPVLRTPKQPETCVVTRTRSKTLMQSPSPRVKSAISCSKSFPVRMSGRMSDVVDGDVEESEWDIAAAYGRFSKASSAMAQSTIEEAPEQMEIDIGGRNCVLVTGYAF